MPVKLYTGLPGAGKTARMVDEIVRLHDSAPDRPVYQMGIDGLADGVAETLTLDQLHAWEELPPKAIIALDECQEPHLFPLDQGKPAAWVKRLSKVRHEGMDLLLSTQHPNMMSSHIRRLVDLHVHLVRKFNTSIVMAFQWSRCMENCEKESAQRSALKSVCKLPSRVFDLYKSANAHTMKARVPLKAWLLPVLGIVAVAALVAIPLVIHRVRRDAVKPASASMPAQKSKAVLAASAAMREKDYGKWMSPRVPGIPWTAPAFDQLQVQAQPAIYCIAVEDGRCVCHSEQGTTVNAPASVCRSIAANGIYNPFLRPSERRDGDLAGRGHDRGIGQGAYGQRETAKLSAGHALPAVSGAQGPHATLATDTPYVPPTYGPWNPQAL